MAQRRNNMSKLYKISIIILFTALFFSCGKKEESESKQVNTQENDQQNVKVTFLELGSVSCIPCRQMQPIMQSIEKKYKGQVKVIFHDVWKDKRPAQQYGIKLIPTQVFLDENGKEFFRHEGFFPEDEIDKLFATKGLTITN